MNTIETDQYGNILKRIIELPDYYCRINYEYNQNNDLISIMKRGKDRCVESFTKYGYTYDIYGNKVKKHIKMRFNHCMMAAEQNRYYNNIYVDKKLKKIIKINDNYNIYETDEFNYLGEILQEKIVIAHINNIETIDVHKYDYCGGILNLEHISRNNMGEICKIQYKILPDGKYSKKLLGPLASRYAWKLTAIESKSMYFLSIEEPVLNGDILSEIIKYVIERTPEKAEIILDICNSDDFVYNEELQRIEEDYNKMSGGHICRVM